MKVHVGTLKAAVVFLLISGGGGAAWGRYQAAAKTAADYWPFHEGSTWTLDTTVGDKKMTQVVTVTKVTTKDGKTRAELDYKSGGRSIQLEVYEADANSLVRLAAGPDAGNKLTPPFPVILFPLTPGKKWDWKGEVAVGGATVKGTSTQSVSGPETVKTDAGSFSAMRVHVKLEVQAGQQTATIINDYWFAPHVGLVRQKATIGNQVIEGIMTSYKLAK